MSAATPTIVLVRGAFADSTSWDEVITMLHDEGHDAVAAAKPLRSVTSNASYITDVLKSITSPVVLFGRSYGGRVITEAASHSNQVEALVYIAAFAPDHGESALEPSNQFHGSTLGEAQQGHPLSSGGTERVIRKELFHYQFAATFLRRRPPQWHRRNAPSPRRLWRKGIQPATQDGKPIHPGLFWRSGDELPRAALRFHAERTGSRGTTIVPGASQALSAPNPDVITVPILKALQPIQVDEGE